MTRLNDPTSLPPSHLGAYRIVRTLRAQESFLALNDSGRHIVLKMLASEAILRGDLHPSIRERLARVRELAHQGVANLYSVERDGSAVFLVWEHIDGVSLEDFCREPRPALERLLLARELMLLVESFHAQGLVHGAIHPRNVIVEPTGRVRLTHVSPLLFSDPQQDADAVIATLRQTIAADEPERSPIAAMLGGTNGQTPTLREIRADIASLIETKQAASRARRHHASDAGVRKLALAGALAAALVGLATGAVFWKLAADRAPSRLVPPEADPAALQQPSH